MKHLIVSFSGGRTSAMMAVLVKLKLLLPGYEHVHYLFANTGQEHNDTLRFVNDVDRKYNLGVVWLEAVVNPIRGKGTTHRIVNHNSATRWDDHAGPFRECIKKFGIPNRSWPVCTRELKLRPMESYIRSIGIKSNERHVAIGIRSDEMDRVSLDTLNNGGKYPLIDSKITKESVLSFWRGSEIDLNIPERAGNCLWCHKKSFNKLAENMTEHPEWFDFPRKMERDFEKVGAEFERYEDRPPRRFYRGNKKVDDIIKNQNDTAQAACSESCEVNWFEVNHETS